MIKRYGLNKFIVATMSLIIIMVMSILPNNKLNIEISNEKEETNSVIYLMDNDLYVSKLNVFIDKNNINEIVKEKLILLRDGSNDYTDFIPLIPKDTKINKINVDKDTITIDFSKELFNIKEELSESMIESIVYSLTEINGINDIIIKIDNKILETYPNTNKIITMPLNRSIGINNEYDLHSLNNINKTTVFFIKELNDFDYYVPVTKVNNNNSEKIDIIIEELKSSTNSMNNLQSYLPNNIILDSYSMTEDTFNLVFNDYIFDTIGSNKILEEVKYTIGLSIFENYDVDEIIFSTKDNNAFDSLDK